MRRSSVRHPLLAAIALWVLITGTGMALLGSYASARASVRPGLMAVR